MKEVGTRVALVTGATGAIGKAIARQIAAHPRFEVILACRDEAKAESAVKEIATPAIATSGTR
jgi:short-subunit dehydrogenase